MLSSLLKVKNWTGNRDLQKNHIQKFLWNMSQNGAKLQWVKLWDQNFHVATPLKRYILCMYWAPRTTTTHCLKRWRNFFSSSEISELFREHSRTNISEKYFPLYLVMPFQKYFEFFRTTTFRDVQYDEIFRGSSQRLFANSELPLIPINIWLPV